MQAAQDSPQQQQVPAYKKGDIVWVFYRGKMEYPARVTAYYPKERKVSHIWFPLSEKSLKSVFKSDVGKVRPFSIEEPLPNNASHEIAYSYDQAVRILNGASMEQVIADYEASVAEQQAQKPTPAKKMSTVELLKKTSTGSSSKGTPKQAAKSAKGTPSSSKKPPQRQQQQEMEEPVRFKPGEQIIVDTQIGMWPGIFQEYVEGQPETIRYKLFPRKSSNEMLTGPKENMIPFPLEQIETSLHEGTGSEVLMEALRDARDYVLERMGKKQPKQVGVGSSAVGTGSTEGVGQPSASASPTRTAKMNNSNGKSVEKKVTTPKEKEKAVPALNSSNKPEQQLPSAEANPKLPKVKATRLSEKHQQPSQEVHSQQQQQPQQLPSIVASPPMKRRKVNVSVTEEEVAMETEEERQLSLFSPRSSGRNKSNSSSLMSSPQNVNATVAVAASLNGHAKRKNEGMGGGGGGKNTGEAKSSQAQKAAGKEGSQQADKRSAFELVMSEEAHEHMRQLWAGVSEEWFKQLASMEFLQMDFRTGGLLTFKETEKLFAEVQQWIVSDQGALKHKLSSVPALTHLREMFYIAKYVLPELCIFALSKQRGIPSAEARAQYEERRNISPAVTGNSPPSNSLDTLVMAAHSMLKAAEEQNGVVEESP